MKIDGESRDGGRDPGDGVVRPDGAGVLSDLMLTEQHLRIALKAARMGTWSFDLGSGQLSASDGCKANFGRSVDQPFTYADLEAAVHPDDRADREAALRRSIETGGDFASDYRILTPEGETRWVSIRAQVVKDAGGAPQMLVGISQDISERMREEAHRSLLHDEFNHRVKNMLTTIQVIAMQTIRGAATLADAGKVLVERLRSLALANELLIRGGGDAVPIARLVERALAPFEPGQIRVGGPDLLLPSRIVTNLSLALHELATNSAKYGALSVPGGIVDLAWDSDEAARRFTLDWRESGGPAVGKPTRRGFGTRLITEILAGELGGDVVVDYAPDGLRFSASAPIPVVAPGIAH